MNHDRSRSDESVEGSRRKIGSELNRRALQKHAAFARDLSVSGAVMSEAASAIDPVDRPDTTESSERASADSEGILLDKELIVKGTGNGVNEYHIETKGNIRLEEDVAGQQGEEVFQGTLRKGRSDSHFLSDG